MNKPSPEEVRVFSELVRMIRTSIILLTMYEFLESENLSESFLGYLWVKAEQQNQNELEDLFEHVRVHHLEASAADDKAGDA